MKSKQKLVGKTVIVNEMLQMATAEIRDIHPVRCEIALDFYPPIQIARAASRETAMPDVARTQKSAIFIIPGFATPLSQPPTTMAHAQTVTRWNTSIMSSSVEWLVRSSSRS